MDVEKKEDYSAETKESGNVEKKEDYSAETKESGNVEKKEDYSAKTKESSSVIDVSMGANKVPKSKKALIKRLSKEQKPKTQEELDAASEKHSQKAQEQRERKQSKASMIVKKGDDARKRGFSEQAKADKMKAESEFLDEKVPEFLSSIRIPDRVQISFRQFTMAELQNMPVEKIKKIAGKGTGLKIFKQLLTLNPHATTLTLRFDDKSPIAFKVSVCLVTKVLPGGQAKKNGVASGWRIEAIDDQKTDKFTLSEEVYIAIQQSCLDNGTVDITFLKKKDELQLGVYTTSTTTTTGLVLTPSAEMKKRETEVKVPVKEITVTFEPGNYGFSVHENIVSLVKDGGQAKKLGIKLGAIIKSVNETKNPSQDQIINAIKDSKMNETTITMVLENPMKKKLFRGQKIVVVDGANAGYVGIIQSEGDKIRVHEEGYYGVELHQGKEVNNFWIHPDHLDPAKFTAGELVHAKSGSYRGCFGVIHESGGKLMFRDRKYCVRVVVNDQEQLQYISGDDLQSEKHRQQRKETVSEEYQGIAVNETDIKMKGKLKRLGRMGIMNKTCAYSIRGTNLISQEKDGNFRHIDISDISESDIIDVPQSDKFKIKVGKRTVSFEIADDQSKDSWLEALRKIPLDSNVFEDVEEEQMEV